MSQTVVRGYSLVSQQIREKIRRGDLSVPETNLSRDEKGWFRETGLEQRIQPSSFEPTLGTQAFVLDIEQQSVFGVGTHQTVYRALLQLPRRQRPEVDITGGFEMKIGFNYLLSLNERVTLRKDEHLESSPKSSSGRLLPIVRMLADYSPSFDECHYQHAQGVPLQTWLLVQPTAFNLIVHPGLTLNQLKFSVGKDVSLTQSELMAELSKNPLLQIKGEQGRLRPASPIVIDDGMQISLDLTGEHTSGIVALRARRNPEPIDMSRVKFYDAEDFFEPVELKDGKIKLHGGERYLLASRGVLTIPAHLNAKLRRHYGTGIRGTWDEAGFIDNGFRGDLVFEGSFNEAGGVTLEARDARPVSCLEFFRVAETPDKVYGKGIGSNYQGQLGPRVSKHFRSFDYTHAARNYRKLNRDVLTHDAKVLTRFRSTREGFEPLRPDVAQELIEEIEQKGFFHSRYDCEEDQQALQILPYALIFGKHDRIFTYVRASNIQDYGESRLFGKYSIGLGGHIIRKDGPAFVNACLTREVTQEEVSIRGKLSRFHLAGTLMAYDTPVDKVHFGLVYTAHLDGNILLKESSITSCGMRPLSEIVRQQEKFETWSRKLIPFLPDLSRRH